MPKEDMVNITLDRDLWDGLSKFAHQLSIAKNKRYPVIKVLRLAIRVFLKLSVKEINAALKRDTRD